jgi:hypothetical protein
MKQRNKIIILIAGIIILAGALRIFRMLEEQRFSIDTYLYFYMAKDWASYGADYMYTYGVKEIPPLLLWFYAMGYNLGLSPEQTGLVVGVVLGSLMPVAAFWTALNLFDEKVKLSINNQDNNCNNSVNKSSMYALLVAFLVAIHPFFIRISLSCLREILYFPLIVFAIGFAVSAIQNKSLWRWGCFGALTALASMGRRESVEMIVIFYIWILISILLNRKKLKTLISYYILVSILVITIYGGMTLSVKLALRHTPCTWSGLGGLDSYFIDMNN